MKMKVKKNSCSSNTYNPQNRLTKAITRDKEGPGNSTSGYLSKETQNTKLKRHTHPYVHCSIIYKSQDMEATQVSAHRQMNR